MTTNRSPSTTNQQSGSWFNIFGWKENRNNYALIIKKQLNLFWAKGQNFILLIIKLNNIDLATIFLVGLSARILEYLGYIFPDCHLVIVFFFWLLFCCVRACWNFGKLSLPYSLMVHKWATLSLSLSFWFCLIFLFVIINAMNKYRIHIETDRQTDTQTHADIWFETEFLLATPKIIVKHKRYLILRYH